MKTDYPDSTPRVLLLDDEHQIHASVRLRSVGYFELVSIYDPQEALSLISKEPFDLCLVDIHMDRMDGLEFIDLARQLDPALGYVIITGFDSEENLRRAIPLQVYDLLSKPLPDRHGFEKRIADWIRRTRARRHEMSLAQQSDHIMQDLDLARIERDVESTAAESAREALFEAANRLTTIQALLFSAVVALDKVLQYDRVLVPIHRMLQEARKHSEDAGAIVEGFFNCAYADREASPAAIDRVMPHAAAISSRLSKAGELRKAIDLVGTNSPCAAKDITAMEFLLMMVPTLCNALQFACAGSTIGVHCCEIAALEELCSDPRRKHYMWINRTRSASSHSGVSISIRGSGQPPDASEVRAWIRGERVNTFRIPSRGLLHGLKKCRGILAISVTPHASRFEMILALPTWKYPNGRYKGPAQQ